MSLWRVDEVPTGVVIVFQSWHGCEKYNVCLDRVQARALVRDISAKMNKARIAELEAELAKLKAETP